MLKNTLIALQGTVIAQGIGFLFMPVLTRLYPPEAFGYYQLYMSVLSVLLVVSSLRYEVAMLSVKAGSEARATLRLCLGLNVVFGIIVLAVCIAIAVVRPTSSLVGNSVLTLIGFGALAGGIYQTVGYVLLREQWLTLNSIAKIAHIVSFCIAGCVTAYAGLTQTGLLSADVIGRIVAGGLVIAVLIGSGLRIGGNVSASDLRQVAHRHRRFPYYTVPGGLLTSSIGLIVAPLMLTAFGERTMGQYALVERMVLVPAGLIGQSIAQVYTAKLSADIQRGNLPYKHFQRISLAMLAIGIVPAAVLLLFGPTLFPYIFGSQWELSGQFAQSLSIVFLSSLVTAPFNMTLLTTGMQTWQLGWELFRLVLIAAVWIAIFRFQITPLSGIQLHIGAVLVTNLAFLWLTHLALSNQRAPIAEEERDTR